MTSCKAWHFNDTTIAHPQSRALHCTAALVYTRDQLSLRASVRDDCGNAGVLLFTIIGARHILAALKIGTIETE
jgi:hypothetical protein